MFEKVLKELIQALVSKIPAEKIVAVADKLLDKAEDAIQRSENEYDNALLLPVIKAIREAFQIKDNDE